MSYLTQGAFINAHRAASTSFGVISGLVTMADKMSTANGREPGGLKKGCGPRMAAGQGGGRKI
jgi:hypothetical protein